MLEAVSNHRPREIHIEIQNPAYYLGIKKIMVGNLPHWDDDFEGMNVITRRHQALRNIYAVKVAILMTYLRGKLESIWEGNYFVGKDFPEEKMWEDLGDLLDSQETGIQKIWDRYFDTICQKLGIK
jgi:hypothetical protein